MALMKLKISTNMNSLSYQNPIKSIKRTDMDEAMRAKMDV